ncbi:hypothetical protein QTG54_010383 [Skeletonema marinoi]|uniref:Uncharacterized protein n=1 Tax=Skeletonema marinoi TaxID=267567 RepID=A0AAD8Y408_9STRA|nr:hypothetical protein QTG54_010383 [Skeletonema marinoi]
MNPPPSSALSASTCSRMHHLTELAATPFVMDVSQNV